MATKEITPIDESKAKNGKLAAVNGGNGDYNADSIKVLGGMEAEYLDRKSTRLNSSH